MKKYYLIVILITLFITGLTNTVLAASLEITVVNASEADIYDLSISPANDNTNTRGPNVLKGQSLLSGQSVQVIFPNYDSSIDQWDLLGVDCCYEKHSWRQLRLNSIHTIILREGGNSELH